MAPTAHDKLVIWKRHDQWNEALAQVAEQLGAGGQPLYLQLDDETLAAAVGFMGEDIAEPLKQLIALVRSTMDIGPHAPPLKAYGARIARWRPESGDPPPCLTLLYVCSRAAMEMRSGDGLNSRNYYGRLATVLGYTPGMVAEIARGYREYAELLWGSLNRWLEYHEGEKGLPTAFALRHRYAGLPMSQALVRRADRARLNHFFAAYGLPPQGHMAPTDLEPILDDWIMTNPCPVSLFLKDLWERPGEARERIASIVSLELAEWDGSTDLPASDIRRTDTLRLLARMRSFPVRKLVLDLSVRLGHDADEALLDVLDGDGAAVQKVLFARAGDGSLTIASGEEVEGASLVAGTTRLRGPAATGERKPRLLVPLREDDLLQGYVETERVQLGETCMLLAPSDRAIDVARALGDCAAPGWQQIDALPGLPMGWALFVGVEIFAPLERSRHPWVELEALVPLGATQLTLAGGLRMPTKLRKWSTFMPPEVRAVLPHAESAEVAVKSLGGDGWSGRWSSEEGVILVNLGQVGLDDGDFMAQLHVGGRQDPVSESIIRLRSADTPNRVPSQPELGYGPTGTESFSAAGGGAVRGATNAVPAPSAPDPEAPLPPRQLHALVVRRVRTKVDARPRPLVLGDVTDDSCVATGAHRIELPTAMGGNTRRWVEGTCRTCGLVKRYPPTHAQARKRKRTSAGRSDPVDVSRLRPVETRDDIDWHVGFDALCHLGRGSATALERIGLQMEPSKLFVDSFTRTLEALAHLDVQRNTRTWKTESWQVPPPALVEVGSGEWFLCGWRSEQLTHALAMSASQHDARVDIEPVDSAPDGVVLRGAGVDDAVAITQSVNVEGQAVAVLTEVPLRLLSGVPPLQQVAVALPRVSRGDVRKVEVWDPESARWDEEERPRSGFLRLHGSVRTYCMMTRSDLEDGVLRPMTPQLLKHVAGALTGRPLVAWRPVDQVLAVPKGCDLPGLLGRAVTLCSGRPPRLSEDGASLLYVDVPEEIAREVYTRLGGKQ